jgi:type VI secretion system protein ImpL
MLKVFLIILLFVLVTLLWVATVWLEWPLWIAILVTSLVVMGLVIYVIVKEVRARRASKEIEKALRSQAERESRSARPDRQADIVALQGEFERAVSSLKSSRIGARGASMALYQLPWYVIVGRPGAGKSTALRRSGLEFPFRSARGDVSVRGVGGTRNCEWWMTREAVILDTAGRYTSEESDREEWLAFLDLLKRYRKQRPINGILATISATELASGNPTDAAVLAREVRGRVDELQDRLGVVAPVYLIITKCDLLPGFVEMFADLPEDQRSQIWGFTLPARSQRNLAGQCAQHFDELLTILEKRTLRRLIEEPRIELRDRIYAFPQHFAALREALLRFVHDLTVEDAFHETPVLRGAYWSSGTQEGRPRDAIMTRVASAFGFRPMSAEPVAAAPTGPESAKSYFLGDLFSRVIFPDYNLAGRSAKRTRMQKAWVNAVGIVGLAIAVALVWLPLMSFKANRDIIGEGELGVESIEQHLAANTVDAIRIDRLTTLRELIEVLEGYRDEGSPWDYRMGMYQGNALYPHLRDVFASSVRNELLLPMIERELAQLEKFAALMAVSGDAPTDEQYDEFFDRLRLYLLVSSPSGEGEPGLVEEERKWLMDALADRWATPLRDSGDPASRTSMTAVADTYIGILIEQPELAFERDATLVERVRRVLNRSDRTKSVTRKLVQSVQGRTLRLTDMVAAKSIRNGELMIRPAFTRDGYEGTVLPQIESGLAGLLGAQWVVGVTGDAAQKLRAGEVEAIETEYFRQYILEWSAFLQATFTEVPDDFIGAMNLLSELTRGEPYKDLFSHIAYHTQLVDLEAADDPNPDDALLSEAGKLAARRARQKLRLGRVANPRLTRMAAESATQRVLDANSGDTRVIDEVDVTYAFRGLAEFGARKMKRQQVEGAPPPPPEAVPVDDYQQQLSILRTALQERLDDPSATEDLAKSTKAVQSAVKSLLSASEQTGWKPTLERILWPPIELVWSLTAKGVAEDVASKWCSEVVDAYTTRIGDRYPFDKDGSDLPLADLEGYFHPENGEVWKFYDAVLKNAVLPKGRGFELAESGSRTLGRFKPNVTTYLEAVNEVSLTVFSPERELGFELDVLIEGAPAVKEVVLTVDGQEVRHRNGPEVWTTIKWPGESSQGARLEARGFGIDADLEREGEWGLFRLLEEGKARVSPERRTFAVQWDFRDESAGLIQVRFRPRLGDTPFYGLQGRREFMQVFRNPRLRVPQSIMVDGPGCRRGAK